MNKLMNAPEAVVEGPHGQFAERLGVSRLPVSELLNEKRACSPEMAARLTRLLDTAPESALAMQDSVDLWQVKQAAGRLTKIKPIGATG